MFKQPHPHLEDGTVYRQVRPTKPDRIKDLCVKNLCVKVRSGTIGYGVGPVPLAVLVKSPGGHGRDAGAIARNLGMAKNTAKKYAMADAPPAKKLSTKERAKAEALAASLMLAD